MNKGEVEVHRSAIRSANVKNVLDLVRHTLTLGAALFAIHMIMGGIIEIVKESPERITALAKVIEAIKLVEITGIIVGAMGVTAWKIERTGKKRAYKTIADLRNQIEEQDAYNAGSGLTVAGDTPKSKRRA